MPRAAQRERSAWPIINPAVQRPSHDRFTLALALFADPSLGQPQLTRASLAVTPAPALAIEPAPPPMLQSVAVTLECTAFADGRVGECAVLEETHPGLGFGEAAVALMADATTDRSAGDHRFARTIQFMP